MRFSYSCFLISVNIYEPRCRANFPRASHFRFTKPAQARVPVLLKPALHRVFPQPHRAGKRYDFNTTLVATRVRAPPTLKSGPRTDTTPETGKTIETLAQFQAGLPAAIRRLPRTNDEKAVVEFRALLNIGDGYIPKDANCEHDMTFAQFGVKCAGPTAPARSLSGGNLQKFVMGRELSLLPRVLIVAQPTWGVDVAASRFLRQSLI